MVNTNHLTIDRHQLIMAKCLSLANSRDSIVQNEIYVDQLIYLSVWSILVVDACLDVEGYAWKLVHLGMHLGLDSKTHENASYHPTREPEIILALVDRVQGSLVAHHRLDQFVAIVNQHKRTPVICPQIAHLLPVQYSPHIPTHKFHDIQDIDHLLVRALEHDQLRHPQPDVKPVIFHPQCHIITSCAFRLKNSHRSGLIVVGVRQNRFHRRGLELGVPTNPRLVHLLANPNRRGN